MKKIEKMTELLSQVVIIMSFAIVLIYTFI